MQRFLERRMTGRERLLLYLALGVVLVGVLVFLALFFSRDGVFPASFGEDVTVFRGDAWSISDGKLLCASPMGRLKKELELPGAEQFTAGKRVAAAWGAKDVYLITRSGGVRTHFSAQEDVRQVLCGDSAAAILTGEGEDFRIRVFDSFAHELDEIRSSFFLDGDLPVKAGLSGNELWVLTVQTDGAVPVFRIYLYNVQKKTSLVRIDVFDETIYDVVTDEKNVFAVGTGQILCYNKNGVRTAHYAADGAALVSVGRVGKNAALLMDYDTGARCALLVGGEERFFSAEAADLVTANGQVFLLMGEKLLLCPCRMDAAVKTRLLDGVYSRVVPLSARRVMLYDGTVWRSKAIFGVHQ